MFTNRLKSASGPIRNIIQKKMSQKRKWPEASKDFNVYNMYC